jgi:hypothetical protein
VHVTLVRDTFLYGMQGDLKRCPRCSAPTFFYTAHRLSWSYCALCRMFYTPNRKRDISRFLITVSQALQSQDRMVRNDG